MQPQHATVGPERDEDIPAGGSGVYQGHELRNSEALASQVREDSYREEGMLRCISTFGMLIAEDNSTASASAMSAVMPAVVNVFRDERQSGTASEREKSIPAG